MNKPLSHKTLFLAVLILSVLFASCSDNSKQKARTPENMNTASNTKAKDTKTNRTSESVVAPDFTLEKMDGGSFTLSKHKGQVIVLNVWATWCPPCRKEIPGFVKIQKGFRDKGVLFVGVSLDKKGWEAVRPFAKEYGINYPLVVDNGSVSRKYGPFRAIPVTFIIDKKGKVAYAGTGMINTKSLEQVLKKMSAM